LLTVTDGKAKVGEGVMDAVGVMLGVKVGVGVKVMVGVSVGMEVSVGKGVSVHAAAVAETAVAVMVACNEGERLQAIERSRNRIAIWIFFISEIISALCLISAWTKTV